MPSIAVRALLLSRVCIDAVGCLRGEGVRSWDLTGLSNGFCEIVLEKGEASGLLMFAGMTESILIGESWIGVH
jgi:hypothetical protein